jgi:uncharacterized membrane protein YukC
MSVPRQLALFKTGVLLYRFPSKCTKIIRVALSGPDEQLSGHVRSKEMGRMWRKIRKRRRGRNETIEKEGGSRWRSKRRRRKTGNMRIRTEEEEEKLKIKDDENAEKEVKKRYLLEG